MRTNIKLFCTALFLAGSMYSWAQVKTIKGQVTDSDGFPVADAYVYVEGTDGGVYTDEEGNYSLSVNQGDKVNIEFVGLGTKTITVGDSGNYNVSLSEGGVSLGVMEIEGALGIKRKADEVTAAYERLDSEKLQQASASNTVSALQGKVSGLTINTVSSGVTDNYRLVLRAARSITGNNQAMVVIDGAKSSLSTLMQLPTSAIKEVNVLKGLQAAALYGSDGVNGAIIVTTNKGTKSGDVSVSLTSTLEISDIAYLPETQLRYGQGWDGEHFTTENGSWGPEFDGSIVPIGLLQADGTQITAPYSPIKDNIKEFFKNGLRTQNNFTITSGNMQDGYVMLSATNLMNDFVIKGDRALRNSFLVKAGKKSGRWTTGFNVNYITQSTKQTDSRLYDDLLQTPSNIPIELFQNSTYDEHWTEYYENPYWRRDNFRRNNKSQRFSGQVNLGYEFSDHFNISYLGNYRTITGDYTSYNNPFTALVRPTNTVTAAYVTSQNAFKQYYGDLMFNFNFDLTDDLNLKFNIGNNIQDTYSSRTSAGGTGFEILGIYSFSNILNPYNETSLRRLGLGNATSHFNKASVFANVDLGYKDYLFLNLTGRNDWSSVFSKDNNSFFYPSAGVSFIPTKAFSSIYSKKGLSYLKVSANVSRVGNDSSVNPYDINRLTGLGLGYPFNGTNSYVEQVTVVNPEIKPEFVTSYEGNVNLGLFDDRLTVDVSAYKTKTTDLITNYNPSITAGAYRVKDNIGDLETSGYELDFGIIPLRSKDKSFEWEINASFSQFKTEITKLTTETDGERVTIYSPYSWVGIYAQVGQEYPLIIGSAYERDDYGRIIVGANGNPTQVDNQILGKTTPDYIIGLNSSIKYKNFKLSATMDYRGGKDYKFYSDTKRSLSWTGRLVESGENRSGFIMNNSSFDYNGNGTIEADEANTSVLTGSTAPAFLNYYSNIYSQTGENLVIDASAFRLREVALSYTLNNNGILNGTGVSELTIGVNAKNPLAIFSGENRGYGNPENSVNTGNATSIVLTSRYPELSYYGATINIKF